MRQSNQSNKSKNRKTKKYSPFLNTIYENTENIPITSIEPNIKIHSNSKNIDEELLRRIVALFGKVVVHFHKHYETQYKALNRTSPVQPNICCDENEFKNLLETANSIKMVYPQISDKDICISLVYIYYMLSFLEPITDYLRESKMITRYADEPLMAKRLIHTIMMGHIKLRTGLNSYIDLAALIRRKMLGMERRKYNYKNASLATNSMRKRLGINNKSFKLSNSNTKTKTKIKSNTN
jgi:hypothetical protein